MKMLLWGDYVCSTGFGTVNGNIARQLSRLRPTTKLDVLAINYYGEPYDTKKWPGTLYPAIHAGNFSGPYSDYFGRQRLIDRVGAADNDYDVLFAVQDSFVLRQAIDGMLDVRKKIRKPFKIVFYFPVDAPLKKSWVETIAKTDYPVTYTEYGRAEIAKHDPALAERTQVIGHGTNLDDFKPVNASDFRKAYFPPGWDDKFILTNVNRNQPRKDIARSLMILKDLKAVAPGEFVLYLHMQTNDFSGNLLEVCETLGLVPGEDVHFPDQRVFNANQGLPIELLNLVYNASDALITTTLGEGWGLSVTEAMACKLPVIAPDNTSLHEILADGRGVLVPTKDYFIQADDNERLRPLVDRDAFVQAILEAREGTYYSNVEKAYAWVQQHSWATITDEWVKLFDSIPVGGFPLNRAARRQQKGRK